jgi:hypothetical protein
MPLNTAINYTLAACAVLLLLRALGDGVNLLSALLLVPFFFCCVPVVSYVCGRNLYLWNKFTGRFDSYDVQGRPRRAAAMVVFFAAAALAFAVMFFKLVP